MKTLQNLGSYIHWTFYRRKKISDYLLALNKASKAQYDSEILSSTEFLKTLSLPPKRIKKPNFKYNEEESSRSEEYGNKKIKIPPMPTFSETGNLNCSLLKLYFKLKNVLIIFTSGNFMKDVKVSEPCTIISEPNYNYKL